MQHVWQTAINTRFAEIFR